MNKNFKLAILIIIIFALPLSYNFPKGVINIALEYVEAIIYVRDNKDGSYTVLNRCNNGRFVPTDKKLTNVKITGKIKGTFKSECKNCTTTSTPQRPNKCISPPNFCGQRNKGTGSCPTPPNPSYLGESCTGTFIESVCGEDVVRIKYGVKTCEEACINFEYPAPLNVECPLEPSDTCPDGSEPRSTAPFCPDTVDPPEPCLIEVDGQLIDACSPIECVPGVDDECTVNPTGSIEADITANPLLVRHGEDTKITWRSTNADSCQVFINNETVPTWSTKDGRENYMIVQETLFTLKCERGGKEASDEVVVRPLPRWREI